jgi:hypothetical protein
MKGDEFAVWARALTGNLEIVLGLHQLLGLGYDAPQGQLSVFFH